MSKLETNTIDTISGSTTLTLGGTNATTIAQDSATTVTGFKSTGIDDNATSTAVTIDGSQNVGIGTSSPGTKLDIVSDSSARGIYLRGRSADNIGLIDFRSNDGSTRYASIGSQSANTFSIETNSVERMRIDSSGNLLVGTTSIDSGTVGIRLKPTGIGTFTVDGGQCLTANRLTSGGEIIRLKEAGTTIGSISSKDTNSLCLGTGNAGLRFFSTLVLPATSTGGNSDNALDLGYTGNRWKVVYAGTGSINTSDENEKQSIQSLTTTEMNVAKKLSSLVKTYKFNDSVEEKGDNARTHTGLIAQQVKQAFDDESLDASKYAFWCSDTWWEKEVFIEATEEKDAHTDIDIKYEATEGYTEKTRLGLRYSELFSFIQAYNDQRFTELEARITALENA